MIVIPLYTIFYIGHAVPDASKCDRIPWIRTTPDGALIGVYELDAMGVWCLQSGGL